MSTNQDILNLLEEYQVEDDFLAEKFENLSSQKRALIKTAIAFQFSFHKAKYEEEQYSFNNNSGIFCGTHQKASPFLICVIEAGFASPAKLLSALCPAVIADVKNIFIFLPPNTTDSILASLELSGMENIYILEKKTNTMEYINTLNTCLELLSKDYPHEKGRVILFSKDKTKCDFFTQLEKNMQELTIPIHIENHIPTIYIKKENHELINFAYRCPHILEHNAVNTPSDGQNNAEANPHVPIKKDFGTLKKTSINFTPSDHTSDHAFGHAIADISFIPHLLGMQNYGEAMELCYIHPSINIDFFINKKISAQLCHQEL